MTIGLWGIACCTALAMRLVVTTKTSMGRRQVGDERGHAIELAFYVSTLNRDCLALDVAQLTQTLREYRRPVFCAQVLCVTNPIVGTFPAGCACYQRRGEQTEREHDEDPNGTAPHNLSLTGS